MLLYIFTCVVLLGVVKSAQLKSIEPTVDKLNNVAPKQADAIFADVIKNISRVNNVLQDLINNYEQLQKIYKSQENVESVYSDSEIDEIFKSKNGKQSKRTKESDGATKKPNSLRFATQMFWSDHDEDNEDSDDDTKEIKKEEIKDTAKKNNTLEPQQKHLADSRKTTTMKPVTSEESSDDSSDTSLSTENTKKRKEHLGNKPERLKNSNPAQPKHPQAEVIFVDTHKKPRDIIDARMKPKELKSTHKIQSSIQFAGIPTEQKTRYSKVSHSKAIKPELQAQNVIPKASINDTRKVKKIMHAETFSPKKIWNDIINNKPIQLEAHNEITLRRIDKAKRNKTKIRSRSRTDKAALVLITKNKKTVNQQPPSSDDDDLAIKEELKTNVLRQAYGDACLKLVLRKCHKACQKVSKLTCNRVKCKTAARSAFKSYAKTGCIKEFQGEGYKEKQDNNLISTNYRGQDRVAGDQNFVDMTRVGFLSAACLPHVADHKAILRNETLPHRPDPEQNYNILRDRFERACKKISSTKCNNACKYAIMKTCETNTCSKQMKKVYKKNCKTHCKSAYGLDEDNDSDSDSDEDSDDSESESSSE